MRRPATTYALLVALLVAGLWVTSSVIGADDPRREGDVIKVELQPDGSTDTYRQRADGEVVIEHQETDGEVWFESNSVLGFDGKPLICPNGEPLRLPLESAAPEPSPAEIAEAQHGLPDDKLATFNEYTGEFQVVDVQLYEEGDSTVTAMEPLSYKCGPDNEPVLVPLSEVDPEAAARARRNFEQQIRGTDELTGLGQDPASTVRSPTNP